MHIVSRISRVAASALLLLALAGPSASVPARAAGTDLPELEPGTLSYTTENGVLWYKIGIADADVSAADVAGASVPYSIVVTDDADGEVIFKKFRSVDTDDYAALGRRSVMQKYVFAKTKAWGDWVDAYGGVRTATATICLAPKSYDACASLSFSPSASMVDLKASVSTATYAKSSQRLVVSYSLDNTSVNVYKAGSGMKAFPVKGGTTAFAVNGRVVKTLTWKDDYAAEDLAFLDGNAQTFSQSIDLSEIWEDLGLADGTRATVTVTVDAGEIFKADTNTSNNVSSKSFTFHK